MYFLRLKFVAVPLIFIASLIFLGCSGDDDNPAAPQNNPNVFENNYGGTNTESGNSVIVTSDGGYIVAGTMNSSATKDEAYLVKLGINGNLVFEKTFGGAEHDFVYDVVENSDGGYTIGGSTASSGAVAGVYDFYLVRTGNNGSIVWERNFGGTERELGFAMCAASDGGYIIAGGIGSALSSSKSDIYLMKVDNNGSFVWDKTYGGIDIEWARSISPTSDGGYIVTGFTGSFGAGGFDVYLIKTDSNGDSLWTKTFGGAGNEDGHSVSQTSDGGFIITGTISLLGIDDVYLIRTDINGDFQWSKTFGGDEDDEGASVNQTSDGGYIITGKTESVGAGNSDLYIIKTDNIGGFQWEKTFGGAGRDEGHSGRQTLDGGFIITGSISVGGASGTNMYLIKTDSEGNVE